MTEHVYLIFYYCIVAIAAISVGLFFVRKTRLVNRLQSWLTPKRAWIILIGGVLVYAAVFTSLGVHAHNNFGTHIFDLGNMEQAMWGILHGDPLHMTTFYPATNRMFIHVEPIFFFLAPLYALWQDPRMLLFLQAALVAVGAIPLFLLARHKFHSELLALGFGFAYLLLPALHQATFIQFRALTLAVPFILFAYYFFERKKHSLSFIFFLLAMMCREDIAFMVLLFGLVFILIRKQWRFGSVLAGIALLWLLVVFLIIYPAFAVSDSPVQYSLFSSFGGSPRDVVVTIFQHPFHFLSYTLQLDKLSYVLYLFLPFLLFGFFKPSLLLPAIVSFGVVFFHKDATGLMSGRLHYHAPIMAPLMLASVYGASWVFKKLHHVKNIQALVAVTMVCVGFLLLPQSISYLGITSEMGYFPGEYSEAQKQTAHKAIALIPDDASLIATYHAGAHLAARRNLYLVGTPYRNTAEYILLTTYPSAPCPDEYPLRKNGDGPLTCEGTEIQYQQFLEEIKNNPNYTAVLDENDMLLFKHK